MSLREGPIVRSLLRVAIPAAGFQLLVFANNLVDYLWIQMLGKEAASGQTAGWTVFWMLASLGQIFSTGTTAIVARRVGSGDHDAARHAATHAVRGAFLAALAVGVVGWLLVPLLVEINESTPRAAKYTVDYLATLCAGSPIIFVFYAIEGAYKGRGDMRRPLLALATALGINIVLDPVLIHVAGLEVFGAALATLAAFTITGALLGFGAWRRRWITWARGLDMRIVRNVVRIGLPVSMHGIVFSSVYIFIVRETNLAGGDSATAALGLGLRVEGFAYMVSVGFATAAAAMVGQNLGAGRPRRAHAGAWAAVRIASWITGVYGVFFILMPEPVVDWMSPGPVAATHTLNYFSIVAVALFFTAAEIVLEGAFSGAGDTRPAVFLGIPLTIVRIPLAMVLARTFEMGVPGVFWALTWSSVVRGLAFMFWFARGRWIHGKA